MHPTAPLTRPAGVVYSQVKMKALHTYATLHTIPDKSTNRKNKKKQNQYCTCDRRGELVKEKGRKNSTQAVPGNRPPLVSSSGSADPGSGTMTPLAPPLCALHLSHPQAVLIRGTRQGMSSCTLSASLNKNSTRAWVPRGSCRFLLFAFLNDLVFAMTVRVRAA